MKSVSAISTPPTVRILSLDISLVKFSLTINLTFQMKNIFTLTYDGGFFEAENFVNFSLNIQGPRIQLSCQTEIKRVAAGGRGRVGLKAAHLVFTDVQLWWG